MNDEQINSLITEATNAIKENGNEPNHTVGAAVLAKNGEIVTGVNLFHFTGGPCAEIAVIGNAISQGKKELATIVAIGDRDRGILAPCGRCRQFIFDYYPSMQVVVNDNGKAVVKPITALLPDTYSWTDNQL